MSFENDILNKINLINTQLQDTDKKRKEKAVELLEEAKKKLVELIDAESLKEGKVVYKTEYLFPDGDESIDLEYLAKIGIDNMIFVDWSHATPQGREFTFRLNLDQFIHRQSKMTLELK